MTLRPSAYALTFLFAGLFGSACPAPTEDGCDVGTEGCACTPGGSCDPGLTCASSTCVDLGPGSSEGSATARRVGVGVVGERDHRGVGRSLCVGERVRSGLRRRV